MSLALRPYTTADLDWTTNLLVHAFRDDPAYNALFPSRTEEGLRFLMPRLLGLRLQAGASVQVGEVDGERVALLVTAADRLTLGTFSYFRNGLLRAPASLGVATTLQLLSADRAVHQLKNLARPPGPHEEVLTIAVHPDHQGQGHGSEVLRLGLHAGPWMLTTTHDRAIRFYERNGFEVVLQNGIVGAFTAWVLRRP